MIRKRVVVHSAFWVAIQQYSTQGIQFITSIIMARMLLPSDYGVLAMIFIFNDFATMFVDMGFSNALVRKQDCTAIDYSTVFFTNIAISLLLYGLIFVGAPVIADFYDQSLLLQIVRITGLTFIINALYSIYSVQLTKNLSFNIKARISIISTILAAAVGIFLAYYDFGVWALVYQMLTVSIITGLLHIYYVRWRPVWKYSKSVFKELFGFGGNVLSANLLFVAYQNAYNITIGRFFHASDLGFFTRADGYSKLIPLNISTVLMKVMFPVISKIQNDEQELKRLNKKVIEITSFFIFPASLLLAGMATPLISVMLTDKWLPCVPYLQILSISIMLEHICWINWDFILIKGLSNIVLRNRIITCLFSLAVLLIALPFGLTWVAVAKGTGTLFTVAVSIYYMKRIYDISIGDSFKKLLKIAFASILIGFLAYGSFCYMQNTLINLFIIGICCIAAYLAMAMILFKDTLYTTANLLKRDEYSQG